MISMKTIFSPRFWRFALRHLQREYRSECIYRDLRAKAPTLTIQEGVRITSPHRLTVGRDVVLKHGAVLHCGDMDWCPGIGHIRIGDETSVGVYSVLYGAGGLDIGARVEIAPRVAIFSSRDSYAADLIGRRNEERIFRPVKIGSDVILYTGVIVSVGVTIGDGAIVGAGSVVLKDIPPRQVWGGVPARFIKKRSEDPLAIREG